MSKPATPLQTLYRLTVMVGTLTVALMAAYRYGPSPERLASLIDSTVSRVREAQERWSGPPAPSAEPATGIAPFASAEPEQPAPAWPAQATASAAPPLAPSTAEREVVVAPFGAEGRAYRATASEPGPGGLVRRYDAIAETAEQARLALHAKMKAAHRGG